MGRKTSKLPTRIWTFHAMAPISGEDRLFEVLRLSTRYYNRLVEIERARMARFVAIRRSYSPELADWEDEYERADDRVQAIVREAKRGRQRHWQDTGEKTLFIPPELKGDYDAAKAERSRVSKEAKPFRKTFSERLEGPRKLFAELALARAEELSPNRGDKNIGPRIKERANAEIMEVMLADTSIDAAWREIAVSDTQAQNEIKAARAVCGLPAGTYLVVEGAFAAAKKDSAPRPPRFKAHEGTGRLAAQLKCEFGDLLQARRGHSVMLAPNRIEGRKGKNYQHYIVKFGDVHVPVRMHRFPPADARMKWAWLIVRRRGERLVYELQLTMEHDSFAESKRPVGVEHGGHVRLGWGQTTRGVRVATWPAGELVVPKTMLARGERHDLLVGHADDHFGAAKRAVRAWQGNGPNRITHWERIASRRRRLTMRWLCREFAIHNFGERLRDLWREWRSSNPRDLFVSLPEASRWIRARGYVDQNARMAWWLFLWTQKDRHLRQWASDARRGFENARNAFFRDVAIRLATQYETLTIDSYSIADLKQRPAPLTLQGEAPNETAQHNAQYAAPGLFRKTLLEVMGSRCTPSERPDDVRSEDNASRVLDAAE